MKLKEVWNKSNTNKLTIVFIGLFLIVGMFALGDALFNKELTKIKATTTNFFGIGENYAIADNMVYVDDDKVYLSSTPHTIKESSWVYFKLNSKVYNGNIDAIWGFDTKNLRPTRAELYKLHNETKSYTCPTEFFNYTSNYYWCYKEVPTNTSTELILIKEGYFEWGNLATKTVYWNVTKEWIDISDSFDSISYDYEGMNKWWYLKNVNIEQNKDYIIRTFIEIQGERFTTKKIDTKYWFAIKPSSETIQQSINNNHFYALDPWVNSTGEDQNLDYIDVNLSAYYKLNETSGDAIDFATGLHNASVVGNPYNATGKINYGYVSNGDNTNTIVTADNPYSNADFNQGLTIGGWFKMEPASGEDKLLFNIEGYIYCASDLSTSNHIACEVGGDGTLVTTITPPNSSSWIFVVMTHDTGATNTSVYIDGTIRATGTEALGNIDGTTRAMGLGGSYDRANNIIDGIFDEVFVFKRALNGTEILDLYNSGNGVTYIKTLPPSAPEITIDFPANNSNHSNVNINVNYSITTTSSLDSCWYSNDSNTINVSLGSGGVCSNITSVVWSEGQHNVTIYANETGGLEGSSFVSFTIDSINPFINITTPLNNSNSSNVNLNINYTISDTNLDSCWYSNDTYEVNLSIGCTTNITNITWSEGGHNVTIWGNDIFGNGNSSSITFSIDTIPPIINITSPMEVNYHLIDTDLTFNWTISDTSLSSCWYNYDGTNTSVTCSDNHAEINTTSYSNRNITLWANDSMGNEASAFRSWEYRLFKKTQTYETIALEGNIETFYLNASIGSISSIASKRLIYNNTIKISNSTTTGEDTIFEATSRTPNVVATTNIPFYWSIIFNDGIEVNTTSRNQSVVLITADNCSTNTYLILNLTLLDEESQLFINATNDNSSIEVDLDIYSIGSSVSLINFSSLYNETNPARVCLSLNINNSKYTLDAQIKYNSDGRETEYYHLQNTSLTNATAPIQINLYDLLSSVSQDFVIKYEDNFLLGVSDALIKVQRKYISEGLFKTVEIPKTDNSGKAIAHLVINDVIYTFIITKDGEILSTFDNVIAQCQNPTIETCTINLDSLSSYIEPEDYTTLDDFSFIPSYNETTRTIQVIYDVLSGTTSTVSLNVTMFDSLGTTEACSDSLTSSSGTLTCLIPISFGNSSAIVKISKNNVLISQGTLSLEQSSKDVYGYSLVFLTMMLVLSLIGIAASSDPTFTGTFIILGLILAVAFNLVDTGISTFIGYGATILWIIIAILIILIKGSNR